MAAIRFQALAVVGGLMLAGTAGLAAEIPPQPVEGSIDWVYSYTEGRKLANASGKPMFVVFRCER